MLGGREARTSLGGIIKIMSLQVVGRRSRSFVCLVSVQGRFCIGSQILSQPDTDKLWGTENTNRGRATWKTAGKLNATTQPYATLTKTEIK